jgi:4-hydroxy-4-methyl-2-oxoglutarate aldolase
MALAPLLREGALDAVRQFDTCMVANAVETFNVRLHNTGFTNAGIHCMFKDEPPMVGYAATARLRGGEPPMVGSTFHDRGDFWNSILQIPTPRILVWEDQDHPPGRGAFVGDMHSAILKALGCIGDLTNGAERELPSVRAMGIQLFAGSVAVSGASAYISTSPPLQRLFRGEAGRGHEKARLGRKRPPRNRSENSKGIRKEGWSKKR